MRHQTCSKLSTAAFRFWTRVALSFIICAASAGKCCKWLEIVSTSPDECIFVRTSALFDKMVLSMMLYKFPSKKSQKPILYLPLSNEKSQVGRCSDTLRPLEPRTESRKIRKQIRDRAFSILVGRNSEAFRRVVIHMYYITFNLYSVYELFPYNRLFR